MSYGEKGPEPTPPGEQKMPETRLGRVIGRYASTFDNWLTRYQEALAESRNGTYSTQKWMSDVGSFWGEAVSLLGFPVTVLDPTLGSEPRTPPPILSLTIDGSKDTVMEPIPIADPGDGVDAVVVSKLASVAAGASIPPANIKTDLSAGRRSIVVQLVGLKALLSGTAVPAGTYIGNVTPYGQTTPILARLSVERK